MAQFTSVKFRSAILAINDDTSIVVNCNVPLVGPTPDLHIPSADMLIASVAYKRYGDNEIILITCQERKAFPI